MFVKHIHTDFQLDQNGYYWAGYPTFEKLFVDKDAYDYGRYHMHCQAAYRMKDYQGSIDACEIAMQFPSRVCCCMRMRQCGFPKEHACAFVCDRIRRILAAG